MNWHQYSVLCCSAQLALPSMPGGQDPIGSRLNTMFKLQMYSKSEKLRSLETCLHDKFSDDRAAMLMEFVNWKEINSVPCLYQGLGQ